MTMKKPPKKWLFNLLHWIPALSGSLGIFCGWMVYFLIGGATGVGGEVLFLLTLGCFVGLFGFLFINQHPLLTEMKPSHFWVFFVLAHQPETRKQLIHWHMQGRVFTQHFIKPFNTPELRDFFITHTDSFKINGLTYVEFEDLSSFSQELEHLSLDKFLSALFSTEEVDKARLQQNLPSCTVSKKNARL